MVKSPPANAGHIRDRSLIPGAGGFLEEEMATHTSILVRKTLQTEKPGWLQSVGLLRAGHD